MRRNFTRTSIKLIGTILLENVYSAEKLMKFTTSLFKLHNSIRNKKFDMNKLLLIFSVASRSVTFYVIKTLVKKFSMNQ